MTILRSQYIERFPYSGFTAIMFAFASMIAAIFVLFRSNGKPIDHWPIQPSVVLSIASAIFKLSLAFALAEGAIVFCWNRALRGSTIKNLSRDWEMATNLNAALLSGRNLNLVAIATIVREMTDRKILTTDLQGCTGNCSGVLRAAGLFRTCDEPTYDNWNITWEKPSISYSTPVFQVSTQWNYTGVDGTSVANESIVLNILKTESMNTTEAPPELQHLVAKIYPYTYCNALFSTTMCTFSPAVMEYEFSIIGNNVQPVGLQNPKKVDDLPGYLMSPKLLYATVFGGIALYLQDHYSLNVSIQTDVNFVPAKPESVGQKHETLSVAYSLTSLDTVASQYIHGYDTNPDELFKTRFSCNYTWSDPMNDIVKDLNELMFRSALYVGATNDEVSLRQIIDSNTGSSTDLLITTKQEINGTQISEEVIFMTNFAYMSGGLVVMLLGILSVVPIFFGYWNLSHHTRLNPFDMAQAFHSSDLPGASVLPHTGLKEPSGVIDGENKVFGVVTEDGKSKLMYEDPQSPTPTNTVEERMLERMSQQ